MPTVMNGQQGRLRRRRAGESALVVAIGAIVAGGLIGHGNAAAAFSLPMLAGSNAVVQVQAATECGAPPLPPCKKAKPKSAPKQRKLSRCGPGSTLEECK